MRYLVWEYVAPVGSTVCVTLDKQANVLLMTPLNYAAYKRDAGYKYYGGLFKMSPARITVPFSGTWYVVVDLGGYPGSVRASSILIP